MKPLSVHIEVNPCLFVKDPTTTSLGKRMLGHSVTLLDEIGLDQFTFKKLATAIGSSEPSVYRYFENKHQLFVYLLNWYWEWIIARIDLHTLNIRDPKERLWIALDMVVDTVNRNTASNYIDEVVLHRVVVREGAKGYHHILVDEENEDGFFLAYKELCGKIADLLLEIRPDFPYPRATASMLVETANNNLYFAEHLPLLTDLPHENGQGIASLVQPVENLLKYYVEKLLEMG